jgi:hypothetical protein
MTLLQDRIVQTFVMKDRKVDWIVEGVEVIKCKRCRAVQRLPVIRKSVLHEEVVFEFCREHMECPAPRLNREEII